LFSLRLLFASCQMNPATYRSFLLPSSIVMAMLLASLSAAIIDYFFFSKNNVSTFGPIVPHDEHTTTLLHSVAVVAQELTILAGTMVFVLQKNRKEKTE